MEAEEKGAQGVINKFWERKKDRSDSDNGDDSDFGICGDNAGDGTAGKDATPEDSSRRVEGSFCLRASNCEVCIEQEDKDCDRVDNHGYSDSICMDMCNGSHGLKILISASMGVVFVAVFIALAITAIGGSEEEEVERAV